MITIYSLTDGITIDEISTINQRFHEKVEKIVSFSSSQLTIHLGITKHRNPRAADAAHTFKKKITQKTTSTHFYSGSLKLRSVGEPIIIALKGNTIQSTLKRRI